MAAKARFLDYYLPLLLLVLALVVLLGAPKLYRLWLESQEVDDSASGEELLADFEEAHAAGALDDEELRRVRDLLRGTGGVPELSHPPSPSPPPAADPGGAAPPAEALETPDAAPRLSASEPPDPPPASS